MAVQLCQQPVLPVQAVGVDWGVLEVQNRGGPSVSSRKTSLAYPPLSRRAVIGEPDHPGPLLGFLGALRSGLRVNESINCRIRESRHIGLDDRRIILPAPEDPRGCATSGTAVGSGRVSAPHSDRQTPSGSAS